MQISREWMMTALVPSVYQSKQYNGETMNPYEKNYIASFNRVVGGMFMLQVEIGMEKMRIF